MPIHARLGRSPLIRRAWFIEKLRLDEWYHYRGPSVSLASARVSLRWILFPSLSHPSFLFSPSSPQDPFFLFFSTRARHGRFFSPRLPFSTPPLSAERTLSNDTFIPREDDLEIIEKKRSSPPSFLFSRQIHRLRFPSCDYACKRERERGGKRRRRKVTRERKIDDEARCNCT